MIQCTANPEFIGAQAGAVGILHTWSQFFLPVKALSVVFRGILCRLIEQAVVQEAIKLPDGVCDFSTIKDQCYKISRPYST